jgi:hypothetical protein
MPMQMLSGCSILPSKLIAFWLQGIGPFDDGEFFSCHEVLEEALRLERRLLRRLAIWKVLSANQERASKGFWCPVNSYYR